MKHENNKYYTPEWLIEKIIDKIKDVIQEPITEIIEPAAGDGRFIPYLKSLSDNVYAYDIEPDSETVTKQDFLSLDLKYKKGRIIVGNPPYGDRGNLFRKFIIKASKISDYIVFILQSSQYNRNYYLKNRCSLIYSEKLDNVLFDTIDGECGVETCLNIYDCKTNDIEKYNFDFMNDDIDLLSLYYKDYKKDLKVDYYINSWGHNQGKLFYDFNRYSYKVGIKIKNESLRNDFNMFFNNFYVNYYDEIRNLSKNGKSLICSKPFIQEKLKKDFYLL